MLNVGHVAGVDTELEIFRSFFPGSWRPLGGRVREHGSGGGDAGANKVYKTFFEKIKIKYIDLVPPALYDI